MNRNNILLAVAVSYISMAINLSDVIEARLLQLGLLLYILQASATSICILTNKSQESNVSCSAIRYIRMTVNHSHCIKTSLFSMYYFSSIAQCYKYNNQ